MRDQPLQTWRPSRRDSRFPPIASPSQRESLDKGKTKFATFAPLVHMMLYSFLFFSGVTSKQKAL